MSEYSGPSKAAWRADLLSRRRAAGDRAWADRALRGVLVPLVAGRSTVAAYVPLPGEPGGDALPAALAAVCACLLLPVVLPDRDLDWAVHAGQLVPAALGLREPPGPRLGPDALTAAEIVVVPALAVDRRGVRLGRGGGSYDRALARLSPGTLVVAALYDGELVDALPAESHDRRVHAAVTPSGLVRLVDTAP